MFESFTEDARRVILLAGDEARCSGSLEIDSEHLFWGLLRADGQLLSRYSLPVQQLVQEHAKEQTNNDRVSLGQPIGVSETARTVLNFAYALSRESTPPKVWHRLLRLLRLPKTLTQDVLSKLGLCLFEDSKRLSGREVHSTHILIGLLQEKDSFAARIIRQHGLVLSDIRKSIELLIDNRPIVT